MGMLFQETCSDLITGAWGRQILRPAFRTRAEGEAAQADRVWLTPAHLSAAGGSTLGVPCSPPPCSPSFGFSLSGLPCFQAPWEAGAGKTWWWITAPLTTPGKAAAAPEWLVENQDPSSQLRSRDSFRANYCSKVSWSELLAQDGRPLPTWTKGSCNQDADGLNVLSKCSQLGLGVCWQVKNHPQLVAGNEIGAATVENSMQLP